MHLQKIISENHIIYKPTTCNILIYVQCYLFVLWVKHIQTSIIL